jgi:hypothetical protein
MSTCNRMDLEILGSQPIMPKNVFRAPLQAGAKIVSLQSLAQHRISNILFETNAATSQSAKKGATAKRLSFSSSLNEI